MAGRSASSLFPGTALGGAIDGCLGRLAEALSVSDVVDAETLSPLTQAWIDTIGPLEVALARRLTRASVRPDDRPRGAVTTPDAPTPWQTDAPTPSSRLLPPQLGFSDTPSRLMAYLLDGIVPAPVYYVLFALLGVDMTSFNLVALPDRNVYIVVSLVALLGNAVYFMWFWSGGRRATPGQRLFGIQVANAFDGKPLSVGQAFGRWAGLGQWLNVLFMLPILGAAIGSIVVAALWNVVLLLSTIMSPTKQGLHDRFAGSAVVRPISLGNRWAVGCLTLLVALILLEAVFIAWTLWISPTPYLPAGYWDRFVQWMWPY